VQAVRFTEELRRISALPRRLPVCPPGLVEQLTEVLRAPGGTMTLRPTQALALHDIGIYGGAFCALDVGEGKTIISMLAGWVLGAKRPLLILPATLMEKTLRDRDELAKHWLISTNLRLVSYEILGRVQSEDYLSTYEPDLIIADESQKLKNRRAAVTRRVARWMRKAPETKFVAETGSIMNKSLLDFAHVLRWCLKDGAPVPRTSEETVEWASAIDEDMPQGNELARLEPGALLSLCTADELGLDPVSAARRGFRRRLNETPGVIATVAAGASSVGMSAEKVDAAIKVRAITYEMTHATDRAFQKLRAEWKSPADEWPLTGGAEVWADAKELALGLTYTWNPRPPDAWLEPRRDWGSFVREVISSSRTLDSELHVAQAIVSGKIDDGGKLARWMAVRDTFVPNPVPVWFDETVLKLCATWAHAAPGIVWTEHSHFAERLSREAGLAYYGAKGLDAAGRFINDAPPGRSVIASSDANREGRNLQGLWNRNLITSPAEGSGWWNQLIGRTHRPGQKASEVVVDVLLGCAEHANAMRKALAGAGAVRDTTGAPNKLLSATFDWPDDFTIASFPGPRWREMKPERFDAYERQKWRR